REMERKVTKASPLALGEAEPLSSKTKKRVMKEWKNVMAHDPLLFQKAWVGSANRSMSIKQIFGIPLDQDAGENVSFSNLYTLIEDFFTKVIVTQHLDDDLTVDCAQALGARHIDFVGQGFNSAFWDIFMACLRDAFQESMATFGTERDEELEILFEKTFAWVLYNMRLGFQDRKKKESELRTKPVIEELKELKVQDIKLPQKKGIESCKKDSSEEVPSRCRCS
ncbi:hypothetical protein PRIPAC_84128, partial [Pristionchus pacificus]|uniref:Uncharacterized protein n=1 Tax=Pristionchus pacificus TaxID=54126 RepID=A0A2A6BLY1_PRIPA